MPLTPEQREAYEKECEARRAGGFMSLRDATKVLDMHDTYVRTLVRKGTMPSEKDSRGRIWVHESTVEERLTAVEQRRENAELRKAGKMPKYAAVYVPAQVKGLRTAIAEVKASDFDEETKEKVTFVLGELLQIRTAEWETKKAQKAAEQEEDE